MSHAALQSTSSFLKLKELQNRFLFVIGVLIVYRIGAHIPLPGLDLERLSLLLNQTGSGLISYLNMISGGSFSRCTIFSLGLSPYIGVSIAIQMASYAIPALEKLKKEGELGRHKLNQYTRYGAVLLAAIQSFGYIQLPIYYGVVTNPSFSFYALGMITLVAGSTFLVWLGEQISDRGIGNGTSLIIFAGIVSGLPNSIAQFLSQARQGKISSLATFLVVLLIAFISVFIVFMERAQRKIAVHYPKRQQGRHMYAAQSSYLPFKINTAGIMPTIFASHFMVIPSFFLGILSWLNINTKYPLLEKIHAVFSPGQPFYTLIFACLIAAFCFFYTALVLNPRETADYLKKSGAFIPGIRPGEQSAQYIDTIMTRLTTIGCIYLLLVVLLPEALSMGFKIPFVFGSTGFLIVILVVMEIITQIQSLLISHQYEPLLRKARLKENLPI